MLDLVNRNPTAEDLRKFAWTVIVGLIAIGGLIWILGWWRGRDPGMIALGLAGLGVIAGGTCLMAPPAVGRRIYVTWMLVGAGIGTVILPIVMTVMFIVLLPLFTLVRFRDPLRLRLKRDGTYWEPHSPHPPTIERMQRPF